MKGLIELAKGWSVYLVLAIAIAGIGYWAGDHNRNNAWLAKQAGIERDAHKQYQAEVKRGEDAAGSYLADSLTLRDSFTALKEKFDGLKQRAPLIVSKPVAGVACIGVANTPMPPANGDPASDGVSPSLTAGAVWMWNSALTGRDQPAGACSTLDGSPAACAVATPLTLDDAWDNHTTNAQLCAEDRLAHQRLIDFLTQGKAK